MLEKVRAALRLTTKVFDAEELVPLIAACKKDLILSGVRRVDEADALTVRAVVLYCKAHFGYGDESARFEVAYQALKCSMALSGEYGQGDF